MDGGMKTENSIKLAEIFAEIFSIKVNEVKNLTKIDNRKWDSLASVTLIVAIESEFDVVLAESDYEAFSSYTAVESALENLNL
jgi:acyl carrier protein